MAYEGLGQYELGLKYFQKATKLDPLYDEAWFGAGSCLEKKEQWHQALHFFNKAVKIDFNNADYWKALARMDFRVGNIVSALTAFEEASQLNPEDREIWIEWSAIFNEQGAYSRAADVLISALEDIPDDAELYYRIAANLLLDRKIKEAFGFLENALILDLDAHPVLLEYFPKAEMQRTLLRLISQFSDGRINLTDNPFTDI
jgi:tetratricopeptide (TPR) repeat protein